MLYMQTIFHCFRNTNCSIDNIEKKSLYSKTYPAICKSWFKLSDAIDSSQENTLCRFFILLLFFYSAIIIFLLCFFRFYYFYCLSLKLVPRYHAPSNFTCKWPSPTKFVRGFVFTSCDPDIDLVPQLHLGKPWETTVGNNIFVPLGNATRCRKQWLSNSSRMVRDARTVPA